MKDLNIRQEAIKILEEKAGKNLFELGRCNFLLNTSPEARETKMNYWDLIKIKSFFTVKETISKTKRQPMECEKIFANDILDKGLKPKSTKNLSNSTLKTTNNLVKKWAKDMNRHFQRRHPDGQLTHEKKLHINHHQGNTNQNHNEIPPHTCQNG